MKRNINRVIFGIFLLSVIGVAVVLLSCRQEEFNGMLVKNADSYLLDVEFMNGSDTHTLELKKNDVLHIRFETEQGSLYMEIKAPDESPVYRGNGKEITAFTLNIGESGVYEISVEARQAKGIVDIQKAGGNL